VLEGAHHLLTAAGVGLEEIERIVVGIGPGGFTGLRIGLATAAGLGQALRCPVIGGSSLEALAAGIAETVRPGAVVVPAHDARRGELFAAAYVVATDGSLSERIAPVAIAAVELAERLGPVLGSGADVVAAGSGALVGREILQAAGVGIPAAAAGAHRLRAAQLVARVDAGAGRAPVPVYARLPDAEVNRLRAAGAGI